MVRLTKESLDNFKPTKMNGTGPNELNPVRSDLS